MDLILVVEDNPSDAKLIRILLSEYFTVAIATSVSEAKVLIVSTKPSLILLDLKLPDSIDLSALKDLKEFKPEIPIIIYTAYDNLNDALSIGAQAYILKESLDKDKLIKIINDEIVKAQFAKAHEKTDEMKKFLTDNFKDR